MSNKIGYTLWLEAIRHIPTWEWSLGVVVLCGAIFFLALYQLFSIYHLDLFHAFEKIKISRKGLEEQQKDNLYFEIIIPKDLQTTAFQIQQKILKALHSTFNDPIEGPHNFSPYFYFFQKLFRHRRARKAKQVFFTLQVWAQYPAISFRLCVPIAFFQRVEKAIFNAYPNAEISMLKHADLEAEIAKHHKSYLSFGQSTIEGKFYHRIKTFKDVSSDPVDSIVSAMEALPKGRFMAYNITVTPTSHYFNQVIHHLIQEQERLANTSQQSKITFAHKKEVVSDLTSSQTVAMEEKMKAPLFAAIISYWTVSETPEDAESKLSNIQAVLTEVNQKNMNTLKHKKLFTKQIDSLIESGQLAEIVKAKPILKARKHMLLPFGRYKNYGQIISDIELFSLWHLPNTKPDMVSSIKTVKFKKKPVSQQMRQYPYDFYVNLGKSNFRMQENEPIGIPTWDDLKKHVYILGGTGSGKSETLKTILSNILQKDDKEKAACLIIDPKNDFATDLLTMIPEERKEDVIYFNPARQKDRPLSFPFFSRFSGDKSDEERIGFLISIMKRFVQIDSPQSWGPELENILRNLFSTAYLLPEQSLSGLDLLLHEPNQIKNILKYLPPRLQSFWTDSILKRSNNDLAKYLAATNNKIGKFLDYQEFLNIADRMEAKITFEDMINSGKIFIANFGSSSEQLKKYYSVYLSAHIAEAIFGQAVKNHEDRKPCVFLVDEFQRVASDIFETLFSEVRAFNTALVISNQFMGQLDPKIQKSIESNIATKIFMRTQSISDAEIAEKILSGNITTEDIINLPTGTAYIKTLVDGVPQDAMSVGITKTFHPRDIIRDTEEYYIQETMQKYGTPLEVITQRRAAVNGIYYTPQKEQLFREMMTKQVITMPTVESNEQIINYEKVV